MKTTVGLRVDLEAREDQRGEVQSFLEDGATRVGEEAATTAWFATRIAPTSRGIFDIFADEEGREAHLSGKVAAALVEKASELWAGHPRIAKLDVLADKLP